MKDTDWAYFAGIFDGEGSIGLSWDRCLGATKAVRLHPVINLRMTVNVKEKEILDKLQAMYGGSVKRHPSKQAWRWSEKATPNILNYLAGFLVLKERQAKVALEILRLRETSKVGSWIPRDALFKIADLGDELYELHSGKGGLRLWTGEKVKAFLLNTGQGSEEERAALTSKWRDAVNHPGRLTKLHDGNRKRLKRMWGSMDEDGKRRFMQESAWKNKPKIDPETGRFLKAIHT